jgi:hypothetical protein
LHNISSPLISVSDINGNCFLKSQEKIRIVCGLSRFCLQIQGENYQVVYDSSARSRQGLQQGMPREMKKKKE